MRNRRDEDLSLLGELSESYSNLNHAISDLQNKTGPKSAGEKASDDAALQVLAEARDRAFQNLTKHAENLSAGLKAVA